MQISMTTSITMGYVSSAPRVRIGGSVSFQILFTKSEQIFSPLGVLVADGWCWLVLVACLLACLLTCLVQRDG